MAKDLYAVLVDLQAERRRLVDAVISPLVRADDQLDALFMLEARLPGRLLASAGGVSREARELKTEGTGRLSPAWRRAAGYD
jgi:hypothetical protein